MVAAIIGKDNIALEKKKQSALTKAVKRVKQAKGAPEQKNVQTFKRGIIMLKHIPHGFYENELRGFLSQFGKVLRLRVGRSKKTGKSRGYAFVEFEYEEVAQIAAQAMNNYLMFERLIKCEVVSPDVDANKLFRARHIRENNCPKIRSRNKIKREQNRKLSKKESEEILQQRISKLEEQNKKLAEMGIDYQYAAPQQTKKDETDEPSEDEDLSKEVDSEISEEDDDVLGFLGKQFQSESSDEDTEDLNLLKSGKGKTPSPKLILPKKSLTPAKNKSGFNKSMSQESRTPKPSPKTPKNIISPSQTKSDSKKKLSPVQHEMMTPKQKGKILLENTTPVSLKKKGKNSSFSKESLSNTPNQKNTPIQQRLTPENRKITPKKQNLTPQKNELNKMTKEDGKITPKLNTTPSDGKQRFTVTQGNITPEQKMSPMTSKVKSPNMQSTAFRIDKKITPKKPKSPKENIQENMSVDEKHVTHEEESSRGRKRKASGMPKFSPKLLRSRKSNAPEMKSTETGAMLTDDVDVANEGDIDPSTLPQNQSKSKRKSMVLEEKKKTPEKPKFSPKLLRSRKSQGPNTQTSNNNEMKQTPGKKVKASDLPKISPKLLRSRKSDAAGLTPSTGKTKSPAKQKNGGRKSVF